MMHMARAGDVGKTTPRRAGSPNILEADDEKPKSGALPMLSASSSRSSVKRKSRKWADAAP